MPIDKSKIENNKETSFPNIKIMILGVLLATSIIGGLCYYFITNKPSEEPAQEIIEENQEKIDNEVVGSSNSFLKYFFLFVVIIIIIIILIILVITFFVVKREEEGTGYPLPELKLGTKEKKDPSLFSYIKIRKDFKKAKEIEKISKQKIEELTNNIITLIKTSYGLYIQNIGGIDLTKYSNEYFIDFCNGDEKNDIVEKLNNKNQIIRRINIVEHLDTIYAMLVLFFESVLDIKDFQKDYYDEKGMTAIIYIFFYTVIEPFFACIKEREKGKIWFISDLTTLTMKIFTIDFNKSDNLKSLKEQGKINAFLDVVFSDTLLSSKIFDFLIKKYFPPEKFDQKKKNKLL